jgi:RNA polymerase sigma-70 factor (ECF subfamily)
MIGIRERASPVPDGALLSMAAQGDVDAFDALLRPRLDRLFRISVAITRSEPDARDAVQEGCLKAWTELPRLRQPDRFDAWLTQIVVNACRTLLRKRRAASVRLVSVDADPDGMAEAVIQRDDPIGALPEVEAIRAAFERLDPTTRALLALHYVDERPVQEIGGILGVATGTVKWRLWNARRALDRALKAERR